MASAVYSTVVINDKIESLNQADLADILGVDHSTVSTRMRNGGWSGQQVYDFYTAGKPQGKSRLNKQEHTAQQLMRKFK